MKIISGYKDYYDYLQGVRGVDNKIVYERTTQVQWRTGKFEKKPYTLLNEYFIDKSIIDLFICNNVFQFKYNKDHFDVHYVPDKLIFSKSEYNYEQLQDTYEEEQDKYEYVEFLKKSPNITYDCPVVLLTGFECVKNPKLSEFNMGRYLSPENIHTMLYNWLSFVPDIKDNRTDEEKIISNGFDKKVSFRKM